MHGTGGYILEEQEGFQEEGREKTGERSEKNSTVCVAGD